MAGFNSGHYTALLRQPDAIANFELHELDKEALQISFEMARFDSRCAIFHGGNIGRRVVGGRGSLRISLTHS